MIGRKPDLSGLAAILNSYPGVVERIVNKLVDGVAPSAIDAGHLEDEAEKARVDGPTRREAVKFALVGLAVGSLDAATHKAYAKAAPTEGATIRQGPIRPEFLKDLISREYSDKVFDKPIEPKAWPNATMDEQALHDSHYFLRAKLYKDLGRNLSTLEDAYNRATELDAKAFIAQRLVIDNNALAHGLDSARYAAELKTYAPEKISANFRTAINSRSIDVICTATLNTMPRKDFLQFSALDTGELEGRYLGLGVHMRQSTNAMILKSIQGLDASINAVIQSKWIQELQLVDPNTPGYLKALNKVRHDWFEEVYAVANGLGHHKRAKYIAEDFFYTICRIAFHAYACRDYEHLTKILHVYRVGRSTMKPHLVTARNEVMKRSAPNIQWVRMLSIRADNPHGGDRRDFAAAETTQYQKVKEEMGAPANAVIERAFTQLGTGHAKADQAIDDLVSTINKVPTVYNQKSYFDIIVNGLP